MSAVRKILAGAVAVVTALVAISGPAAAAPDDGIEITVVDAAAYPTVTAVVATPPGFAGARTPRTRSKCWKRGRRSRPPWSA